MFDDYLWKSYVYNSGSSNSGLIHQIYDSTSPPLRTRLCNIRLDTNIESGLCFAEIWFLWTAHSSPLNPVLLKGLRFRSRFVQDKTRGDWRTLPECWNHDKTTYVWSRWSGNFGKNLRWGRTDYSVSPRKVLSSTEYWDFSQNMLNCSAEMTGSFPNK